ncbi:KAP family P-loop NTPase fold protein [Actinobacillus equuli]|uniref:KAP family P-loop NTPase fold protein n=1 Tax=Actinobacillus equuli TaxID=718 RepID=UPI0024183FB1|nr:P-loop NTPase fold protein [Actinobacillus equuli]MDG4952978.1 KAP family NTPase [Actinobacillus equuli subsp. equuli]
MELNSDNPIKEIKDDLLDRTHSAQEFAKHIFSFDYKEGLVVGVHGEWGCGKTSYINLMRPELEKNAIVIDFNPWMFSDAHNLVSLFFTEMAAQLEEYKDTSKIADTLNKFGELFSLFSAVPIIGEYAGWLSKGLNFLSKRKKNSNSLQKQRKELVNVLSSSSKPIIVILDDIDRLSSDELLSILKLVRVTGNFPNIIYLLSFDKERVVKTLNAQNIDGEAYLEKIIQIPFDVPRISPKLLEQNFFSSLDNVLGDVDIDRERWASAYFSIVKPSIKNLRDVRRYVLSLSNTYNQIGKDINIVDLLSMEIIRVFYPKEFSKIFEIQDSLFSYEGSKERDEILLNFIENKSINRSVLSVVFDITYANYREPAFDTNSHKKFKPFKRIAEQAFFNLYFEHIFNSDIIEIQLSEKVWNVMPSKKFDQVISNIPSNSLENVIKNLMEYENQFTDQTALFGIPALYKILPKVPKRNLGMFDFGPDVTWSRLTYRLLKAISDNSKFEIISKVLDSCDLFGQYEVIGIIGYREGRGHKLVSEDDATKFENKFKENIQNASLTQLANTYNLSHILYFFASTGGYIKEEILSDHRVLISLLKSAISETRSQRGSDPTVHREKILLWDALIKIFNDNEEKFKKLIEELSEDENLNQEEFVKLAVKYKDGYRHSDKFTDED